MNKIRITTFKKRDMESVGLKKSDLCPWGVAFDATRDRILVTDTRHDQVRVLTTGTLQTKNCFGSRGKGPGQFDRPTGITVQPHGDNLVVGDNNNHRVQVLTPEGKHLVTIGTTGLSSDKDGQFNHPIGVCCKPSGNIYVADCANHRVQLFDAAGRYMSKFGTEGNSDHQFQRLGDIAILDHHLLLVADFWNRRVSVWSMDESRAVGNFDVGGLASCICVDLRGYVYVGILDHSVKVFDPRVNFTKCPSVGPLEYASGMCVDDQNTLFVAENYNPRIHTIKLS